MNLKLSKSRNKQFFDRSSTNNSKLKEYIKSVREMYDEQMNKMKLSTQSTRFYDHLKKVSWKFLKFRNKQCLKSIWEMYQLPKTNCQ